MFRRSHITCNPWKPVVDHPDDGLTLFGATRKRFFTETSDLFNSIVTVKQLRDL